MQIDKMVLTYHVKSYECDRNGTLRLLTLMNIFQDAADSHASNLGLGMEYCLQHELAWVGSNYHIKITRMPKLHEKITVSSWPAVEKKLGAIREFVIKDEDGEKIITASSQWVLIDFIKKRPVSLRDNLPFYNVIEERALVSDFTRIAELQRSDVEAEFKVRYDDIDINHHVNNAVYPLWASESVGDEFRLHHSPSEIEIAFKKEGLYGETVIVNTQIDNQQSLHSIKSTFDNRELAKVKILWK